MDKQSVTHLETQLRELHNGLQQLTGGDSLEELIRIIHKPGWTTVAEAELFRGLVDSMHAQMKSLSAAKQVLFSGASQVELNPQPLPPKE